MTVEEPIVSTPQWGIWTEDKSITYSYYFARSGQDMVDAHVAATGERPSFTAEDCYEVDAERMSFREEDGTMKRGDVALREFLDANPAPMPFEFAGDY